MQKQDIIIRIIRFSLLLQFLRIGYCCYFKILFIQRSQV